MRERGKASGGMGGVDEHASDIPAQTKNKDDEMGGLVSAACVRPRSRGAVRVLHGALYRHRTLGSVHSVSRGHDAWWCNSTWIPTCKGRTLMSSAASTGM